MSNKIEISGVLLDLDSLRIGRTVDQEVEIFHICGNIHDKNGPNKVADYPLITTVFKELAEITVNSLKYYYTNRSEEAIMVDDFNKSLGRI